MSDIQTRVQDALDTLVDSGAERGLQATAHHRGERVVDAVSGTVDAATGEPVAPDTLFYTYSTGKAMTVTAVQVLIEQGVFDYDTRIAELWPEFGAHGKGSATIRHALTHSIGVPALPSDVTPADLCDWPSICARIADSEPWWQPGTATGYHAHTFGYIAGEIIRRATGRRISEVLREDVARPLGVEGELYFGVPESQLGRVAPLEDADGSAEFLASLPDDSPFFTLAPRAVTPTAVFGNRRDVLMADIPAGGKMTARAIATLYAALLGDVAGVRLVAPERLGDLTEVAFSGTDQVFDMPTKLSLGFGLGLVGDEDDEHPTTFGWGGVGGSYALADTATGVTFALTKNRLTPDFSTAQTLAGMVLDAFAPR
ncbi:CubicO group peptidase (beta-lactamase class C family) [Haloactinopolyspora alba]|uniref:CubicO group peptidase (Beta-lactamase class C family) n=1 Tax=Haloactinopolyspora alba TaxID=648780 RepID=A0A2P8D5B9_9ACTN|nr:serine hydrolase domain-containing protein [Haloactinopolyspora alba]PSK92389.1 CubicO group peptidase (beta-lactamase class C family) [Haloactinopolyspora alba]